MEITSISELQKLLEELIAAFVEHPRDVETHLEEKTDEAIIWVKVNYTDIGLVIGRGGEHSQALRTIIRLIGQRQLQKRVLIKVDAEKLPSNHFSYSGK